jgi:hypothetical protein
MLLRNSTGGARRRRVRRRVPDVSLALALRGRVSAYHAAGDDAKARADLDRLAMLSLDEIFQAAVAALARQIAN